MDLMYFSLSMPPWIGVDQFFLSLFRLKMLDSCTVIPIYLDWRRIYFDSLFLCDHMGTWADLLRVTEYLIWLM